MTKSARAIIVLIGMVVMIAGSLSCSRGGYSGPAESITISVAGQESCIPLFVAEDQQFFVQNGLNVTMKDIAVGPEAINQLLQNQIDIAANVGDYAAANQILSGTKIKVIASSNKLDYAVVIGRTDRGITVISQLAGKKIGYIRGTVLEYNLGRFLQLQGLSPSQVTLVNFASPGQMTDAIVNGDMDAMISVPPYSDDALDKLGGNAVVWGAQSGQSTYILSAARDEWITAHPSTVVRFLKAIDQAEGFIIQHPENAKSIVKKKLNFSDDQISKIWARDQFSLTLDESLIAAMESEARWAIDNNLTAEKIVPNFTDYIYEDALKAVKPEAVNVIR